MSISRPVIRTYKDSSDLKRMQQLTKGDLAQQRHRHVGSEDNWINAIWEIDNKQQHGDGLDFL